MKIGNRFFDTKNHTYIMGILNVTPDSFSDGGKWNHMDEALKHTEAMIADGADLMIEAGPGTVLSGFMKRINRRIRTLHAEDVETVTNVLNTWEE